MANCSCTHLMWWNRVKGFCWSTCQFSFLDIRDYYHTGINCAHYTEGDFIPIIQKYMFFWQSRKPSEFSYQFVRHLFIKTQHLYWCSPKNTSKNKYFDRYVYQIPAWAILWISFYMELLGFRFNICKTHKHVLRVIISIFMIRFGHSRWGTLMTSPNIPIIIFMT